MAVQLIAPEGVIVTKLHRAEHGELEARLSAGGATVPVTRRWGSWSTLPDAHGRRRLILPRYAAALQQRARSFERAEAD